MTWPVSKVWASNQRGDCSEPGGERGRSLGSWEGPRGVFSQPGADAGILKLRGERDAGLDKFFKGPWSAYLLWPYLLSLASKPLPKDVSYSRSISPSPSSKLSPVSLSSHLSPVPQNPSECNKIEKVSLHNSTLPRAAESSKLKYWK